MSRLLFAAARGARIEMKTCVSDFEVCFGVPIEPEYHAKFRIHPDDEALQYGPISSALRKSAIEGTLYAHANIPYIMGEYDFGNEEAAMMLAAQTQRGMFKLILAEALADEGL